MALSLEHSLDDLHVLPPALKHVQHRAMNHRATSACNCISVPIINVSTAVLFTKAVIIKSQVGEI